MTPASTPFPAATISGYPRIGRDRELKKALEAHWKASIGAEELIEKAAQLRKESRARLLELGLKAEESAIPLDFTYYDQMLSMIVTLGAIPERFNHLRGADGSVSLDGYFTMARGKGQDTPLEMTKWFDSNYHYLVPELGPNTSFEYQWRHIAGQVTEAKEQGITGRPVLVGPLTFLLLSKAEESAPAGFEPITLLNKIMPAYEELLADLGKAGARWVQLDEPALCVDTWDTPRKELIEALNQAYSQLAASSAQHGVQLFVNLSYGSAPDAVETLGNTGVKAIGLDLVKGEVPAPQVLSQLKDVTVVCGLVSGRNIWRTDLEDALEKAVTLKSQLGAGGQLAISTSTSLQHVPYDVERETHMDEQIRSWLAFADQKVVEVGVLATAVAEGKEALAGIFAADALARASRAVHAGVNRQEIRHKTAAVSAADRQRIPYSQRARAQEEALGLPLLPTTTIGSFPQTTDIRKARAEHRAGALSDEAYTEAMKKEVKYVVDFQEKIGMDVFVHGEPERNDMVQYFAELLEGFVTTQHGWVQSYGSRCTRPSILWGDVARPEAMTVEWASYAQSLTDKPMKGMLTGPVTIMAWSFVRDDVPLREVADQLGLALREEIADLEAAGIKVIQVDEPALRELLPLRLADREEYLDWSTGSFRLATSGVRPETQIHTHLCYSEFNVVIDAIDDLDADVTSIEAARSKMEILPAVAKHGFERELGPGVYDIHSPRVPSLDEMRDLLQAAVSAIPARQLWVNPDCGLKTRGWAEVEPTLRDMVQAAKDVRAGLN